ncbi:MAG: ABC transporter substrate-binding protein [Burkholderiales bacterium]|nr:ABC transporter substrate-binding protein [Burkholderiales bacterium]
MDAKNRFQPKFRAWGAACALVMLLAPAQAATPRDTLVIAREISSIADWDPAVSQILDTQEVNSDIYERLVGYDPRKAGSPLAGIIAESWVMTPDGKQFTFRIRKGVKFHSGNPLTAEDVAYTFKRIISLDREPSTNLRQIGITKENVDNFARAFGDDVFVLSLPEAFATTYILNLLTSSYFGIVDKKLLEANAQGGDYGSKWLSRRTGQEPSAGSGPYRITNFRASDTLILERNDAYWRFKSPLRRVIFRHIPESGAQRLLIERGDADMAFNLTTQDIEALQVKPGAKVELFPSRRVLYAGFNMMVKPFDDPRVLRAMKHLIDYQTWEKTLMRHQGSVHQSFIPNGIMGSLKDHPFKYDVARAKELLAEAGLSQGFSFKFNVANRRPEIDMATSFQASAALAGVKVEVIMMPPSQLIPMYRDRKVDALMLSFYGPYGDPHATANKFAYSPGGMPGAKPGESYPGELTWRLGWTPTDLSVKVIAATKESDPKKRTALYADIQRQYWETSPFAQTFQAVQAIGMGSNVENYRYGSKGADTSFAFTSKKNGP